MRVTAFRKESSVDAIADRVYVDLSTASRKTAVAALLRENPQLERLERVQPGAVLRVPEVPGLRAAPRRGSEDPADQIAEVLARRLKEYQERLKRRHGEFQADVKDQEKLLKDRKLRKIISASPTAVELAKQAGVELRDRTKVVADARKRLETAIKKLTKDLSDA